MRSPGLRALCALMILLILPGLCACSVTEIDTEPASTEKAASETLYGIWDGSFDAGDELMRELGFDVSDKLSAPLTGGLRLEIDYEGRCSLRCSYGSCREPLQQAIAGAVRELQEQEAGEPLSGLALAEALGADPNDFAASLCDELLPPTETRSGRLSGDKTQIIWADGAVSAIRAEDGALWLFLPERGELCLRPAY